MQTKFQNEFSSQHEFQLHTRNYKHRVNDKILSPPAS